MCVGDQSVELYVGPDEPAILTLHHEESFRWGAWTWDAALVAPDQLRQWFSTRGIQCLEQDYQDRVRRVGLAAAAFETWVSAAPAALQSFRAQLASDACSPSAVPQQPPPDGGRGDTIMRELRKLG